MCKPIDIIRNPGDTISDIVDDIVDIGSDVSDFLVDDILDPIVEGVEDVYKAIEDDPLYNIAKIGAVATGNSWALPLIDGAKVANNGGDWRDIAEASAKAYVAGKVGAAAGEATNAYVASAVDSEVAARIIGQATGRAASTAVMTGGELDAVKQSFITGGISAGVDEAFAFMDNQSGTFKDLNPSVKNVITTYVKAEANNQDVTNEMMANAALSGAITSDLMREYIDKDSSLSDAELAAITSGFTRTLSAAMTGGNIEKSVMTAVSNYGAIQMKEWMDSDGKNLVNKGIDRVTGTYKKAEEAAARLDGSRQFVDLDIKAYNEVIDKFRPEMEARDAAYEEYVDAWEANQIQPSKATYDAAMAAKSRYTGAVVAFQNKFQTYEYEFNKARVALNGAYNNLEDNQKLYEEAIDNLRQDSDKLSEDLKPLYEFQNKVITEALTGGKGNFNEEEYIRLNELDPDTDAFEHYIKEGRANGAPISEADYNQQLEEEQNVAVQRLLGDLDIKQSKLTDSQETILQDYFSNMTLAELRATDATQISDDVVNLFIEDFKDPDNKQTYKTGDGKEFTAQELVGLLDSPEDNPAGTTPKEFIKLTNDVQVGQQNYDITFADGVTHTDVLTGRAELNTIEKDGKKVYQWQDLSFAPKIPKYNKELGVYTRVQESFDDEGQLNYVETLADGTVYNNYKARVVSGAGEDGQDLYEILNYKGTIKDGKSLVSDTPAEELFAVATTTRNTLDRLQRENVEAFTNTVGEMAKTAGSVVFDYYSEPFLELAEYIYDNSEVAQDIINSEAYKNYVKNPAIGGTANFLEELNGLVIAADIDPTSTPLYPFVQKLKGLAEDAQSEEYKASWSDIQNDIATANFQKKPVIGDDGKPELDDDGNPVMELVRDGDGNPVLITNEDGSAISEAEKIFNTVLALGKTAIENPAVFATEFIGKEVVGELLEAPISLLGGKVFKTSAELAGLGTKVAKNLERAGAVGTSKVQEVALAWGGEASSAYEEAYNLAISKGYEPTEANRYAMSVAVPAANAAAIANVMIEGGVSAKTLNNALYGGKKTKRFTDALEIIAREGISEAGEEGAASLYKEYKFVELDPTRDTTGNITANVLLGMISGSGTTSSALALTGTGDAAANALILFNPEVRTIVKDSVSSQKGAESAQQKLASIGIEDEYQTGILNTIYDEGYVSRGEASEAAVNYSQNSEIPYNFTAQDIDSFVGANSEADLNTSVANYAGQRVTSDFVADQLGEYGYGFEASQDQIDALIDSGFIVDEQTKKDKTQEIIDFLDPFTNSTQDVRDAYRKAGLDPDTVVTTDIDKFTGVVDPNQDLYQLVLDYIPDATRNILLNQQPDPDTPDPTPDPTPDL